jgi:hypothetical protein
LSVLSPTLLFGTDVQEVAVRTVVTERFGACVAMIGGSIQPVEAEFVPVGCKVVGIDVAPFGGLGERLEEVVSSATSDPVPASGKADVELDVVERAH